MGTSHQRDGSPPTSQGSTRALNPASRSARHEPPPLSQPRPLRPSQHVRPLFASSEEQPGLEVVDRPPTRGGRREPPPPAVPQHKSKARSIASKSFWSAYSNRDPSEYTFYREPTPTPDEYPEGEKSVDGIFPPVARRPGRSSTIAMETALAIEPPPRRPKQDVVCGVRKRTFICAVVAIVVLVVGTALGVGIGVGVNSHNREVKSDPAGASGDASGSSSSPPIPSSTISPSSISHTQPSAANSAHTASSSSPPRITPTASPTTDCPFVNNTIYQVPGSSIKFLRLCGVDYNDETESMALSNIPTNSFAGCMDNCAGTFGCTGCSWGVLDGETGSEHQCWMKSKLKGAGHKSVPEWCFGVLQQ